MQEKHLSRSFSTKLIKNFLLKKVASKNALSGGSAIYVILINCFKYFKWILKRL